MQPPASEFRRRFKSYENEGVVADIPSNYSFKDAAIVREACEREGTAAGIPQN